MTAQGICQTAIKKVCRRLGIKKWPYKEMRAPAGEKGTEGSEDSGSENGSAEAKGVPDRKPAALSSGGKAAKATTGGDAEVHAAVSALLSLHADAAAA